MRLFHKSNVFILNTFFFIFLFFSVPAIAQLKPGFINRQATSVGGRLVLDPNSDGHTSATTAGFGAPSDVATSEIPYKIVNSYSIEPFGDLRRGPDHNYSDFVPDGGQDGFYTFFDGTNFMFRFRLGSIMPGSKGYSILIDTDGKFGASGANADPNYQAATTGTNGNPGFEIEIVLETNFRIAIYNVDGTSSPVLITSYTNWQDMSQVSLASTNDNGDPDFFMDFYIPFSALQAAPFNLTTTSPIRMIPTTVMSPQAAIGGPKSDIYGLSDDGYNSTNQQYEDFINSQPGFTLTNITGGGGGIGPMCTAPPIVTAPIGAGTVTISGTWTASTISGAVSPATITIFKNGISIGTVAGVATGGSWNLVSIPVVNGDIITAKAQAAGESMCLVSNNVFVVGCTPANTSATSSAAFGLCTNSRRGMAGTKTTNTTVRIYSLAAGGAPTLFATDGTPASPSTFNIGYGAPSLVTNLTWEYNGANNSGSSDPCSGGPNDIPNGSYYITATEPGKCESAPIFGSCVNLTPTATPIITQTTLYNGSTTVSGTAVANSTVRIYVNGELRSTQTATAGGAYSFANIVLYVNDAVQVFAQATGFCISAIVSRTVNCFSNPPIINADKNNQVTAGQPITGTSADAVGSTIRVFNIAGPALVATTIVQAGGVWTTATTSYNAVAGLTYNATSQNGTCTVSANSGNVSAANNTSVARCGTITAPVAANATSVSGTVTSAVAGTTVNLYLDGELIGTTTTGTTAWTVSSIPATTIYSNGELTIGVRETGSKEVTCAVTLKVVCASSPASPIFTPAISNIGQNQTVTYTITNAVAGTFYAVSNDANGESLGMGTWATANGNLDITTNAISNAGTYNIVIKATNLTGVTVCSSVPAAATINVNSTLPITLISLNGKWKDADVVLSWETENEINTNSFVIERSEDGRLFDAIGTKNASGNFSSRSFYNFTDVDIKSGINYYRLKMIDVDGKYKYSTTLVMRKVKNNEVKLWPNPFTSEINIAYQSQTNSTIELRVTDILGRLMLMQRVQVNKGNNQLKATQLQSLSKGTYLVEIIDLKINMKSIFKLNKQ